MLHKLLILITLTIEQHVLITVTTIVLNLLEILEFLPPWISLRNILVKLFLTYILYHLITVWCITCSLSRITFNHPPGRRFLLILVTCEEILDGFGIASGQRDGDWLFGLGFREGLGADGRVYKFAGLHEWSRLRLRIGMDLVIGTNWWALVSVVEDAVFALYLAAVVVIG